MWSSYRETGSEKMLYQQMPLIEKERGSRKVFL